jgi:two-component system, response regulator RegA
VQGPNERSVRRRATQVLLVEPEPTLAARLREALEEWGGTVQWESSLEQGLRACTKRFELVVLDLDLPDGSGMRLAEAATQLRPLPAIVAFSGRASPSDAFRLAQLGVLAYLPKPLSAPELRGQLESALERTPNYLPHLLAAVGRESFRQVLERVRRAMAEQALAISAGNKTGAARLLGITRQAVQQLIRDLDLDEGHARMPAHGDDGETRRSIEPRSARSSDGDRLSPVPNDV